MQQRLSKEKRRSAENKKKIINNCDNTSLCIFEENEVKLPFKLIKPYQFQHFKHSSRFIHSIKLV